MPKPGKKSGKLSHSLKKVMRRSGTELVKCKKSKRKQSSRKEQDMRERQQRAKANRNSSRHGDDDADMEDSKDDNAGKAQRAAARAELGKRLRLEEVSKRRGILLEPAAKDGAVYELAAAQAADHALVQAPRNQRTYQKELAKVLKEADVLLEVIDARDPLGCRCTPLEEAVMQRMHSKRIVLVLNKVDLVPKEVVNKWLTYLRQYLPTLPFKATGGAAGASASRMSRAEGMSGSQGGAADVFGGEQLLQLLKNYSRSLNMKTAITVGIVGYPNVGKSSVINSLKRTRAVNTGATAGVTTTTQTVSLDKKVKLMDCPGIVFARAKTAEEEADVLLRNCIKIEKIPDLQVPIEGILRRVSSEQLREQYEISHFTNATEFLTLVAAKRGKLRAGGAADQDAAARAVVQDWNSGAIRYWTEPPKEAPKVTFVPQMADEFDWNGLAPRVEEPEVEAPLPKAERLQLQYKGAGESTRGIGGGNEGALVVAPRRRADEMDDMEEEGEQGMDLVAAWEEATGQTEGSAAPRQRGKKISRKQMRQMAVQRKQDLSDEHDRFNLQHNRGIRKQQRADRRKKRRDGARGMLGVV